MSNIETLTTRAEDRILSKEKNITVKNISFGVNLYKNSISKEDCKKYIELLVEKLDGTEDDYSWLQFDEDDEEYGEESLIVRDDFRVDEEALGPRNESNKSLFEMDANVLDVVKTCIFDYATSWEASITSFEPLIFARYTAPTGYFLPHFDDSLEVIRSVSAVLYLNSDYEGGELTFTRLDNLKIKPEPGDLVVFPSTYLYKHTSEILTKGTKYCVIAMSDYAERG
jgi:hypothetical protein